MHVYNFKYNKQIGKKNERMVRGQEVKWSIRTVEYNILDKFNSTCIKF